MKTYTVQAYKNWNNWIQVASRIVAENEQEAIRKAKTRMTEQGASIKGFKFTAEKND